MAERWTDRFGLCLTAAVLSVCSLLLIIMSPVSRLLIDPAGSVGPRGNGCDSDWKLVLSSAWLQPGLDTQLGGTPSEWSYESSFACFLSIVIVFSAAAAGH